MFATPGPPTARSRSTQQYEPLDDAIDTSPTSSGLLRLGGQDSHLFDEAIETDSPSTFKSISERDDRPPKRRRVSVSPETGASQDVDECDESMLVYDEPMEAIMTSSVEEDMAIAESSLHSEEPVPESELPSPTEPSTTRHPTFQNAPRFKVTEFAEEKNQQYPLPDVFSPQRRGEKYIPGGLAAELRDWLVQVKGASEYDRPAGSSVQVTISEARAGNGMWFVAAHQNDIYSRQHEANPTKVILAGDGRIKGLSGKNIVKEGGTVSMYQPMWDITLSDLGQLAVACDWDTEG